MGPMSHFLMLVILLMPLKQSPDAARQILRSPGGRCSATLELARVGRDKFIYFYYAPDIDKLNFETLRQPQNLYRIRINGTGFSISPAQHK